MNGLIEINVKQSNQFININYKCRESLGDEVLNYNKYLMGYRICGLPVTDIVRSEIQIFIKAIDNKILTLEMEPLSKIKDIKMKIQEKTKFFADQQNLIFQGEILNNNKPIEYYEICEKSVIDIVAGLRGGMQIFVKTMDGRKVAIKVLKSDKIIDIKRRIQGFFSDEQKLVYQGEILNDDNKTIDEYQICEKSVINIVAKSNELLFLEAIKSGSLERVQDLYDNKLNEMDKEKSSTSPMHNACKQHNADIVKFLNENKFKNDSFDNDGKKPIHYACQNGNVEILKILIENKCNLEECDGLSGKKPIHYACQNSNEEILKTLIENKCNLEESDGLSGKKPIHYACQNGNVEILKILIENKCNLEESDGLSGRKPIHFACENGNEKIVKLLIENKCNLEECDGLSGRKPIHFACWKGNEKIVKLLIEKKCNLEECDRSGMKPIHYACENRNVEILKLLIENKCNLEEFDRSGMKPIHLTSQNDNVELLKLLIDNKCNLEESDGLFEMKPIHYACWKGNENIVKLLIENKCNLEEFDIPGRKPIHYACWNGNEKIVKLLIENKCNLEEFDRKFGMKPIHFACQNDNVEILKLLIANKCNLEEFDGSGRKPIHSACWNSNVGILKLLIENKCDLESVDHSNRSPFHIAEMRNHIKIKEILNEETTRRMVENMIKEFNLKCDNNCDHQFCPTCLHNKTFKIVDNFGQELYGKRYDYKLSQIAIKQIPISAIDSRNIEGNINRFIKKINHERIIKYFGAIANEKNIFIFMEFMSKRSLKSQIYANPQMISSKVINYTIQILEGLQFLHSNEIIHRNIKLNNILLDNNGNVKLTDLGSELLLCTTYGRTTDYYMAPEIINGEPYSNGADIWSSGVTVIEMATGKLLYPDIDLSPMIVITIGATRKIPYQLSESSPNYKLKQVIDQMLNSEFSDRPSAKQLIDNFKKLL